MTVNELYDKALEIEAKYTSESNLSLFINRSKYAKGQIRYQIKHEAPGINIDTGYGITNIRELLTVFEMSMAARYRFANEKNNNEDLELK
jgi:hypothetical protein